MPYRLSKSLILSGLQCPKRLYLEVHQPERLEESPATDQTTLWWGFEVLKVARALNQNGILIGHDHELKEALSETTELLRRKSSSPLFEATFGIDGVLIRSDVLFPKRGKASLVEVKASTHYLGPYVQ